MVGAAPKLMGESERRVGNCGAVEVEVEEAGGDSG